jgi:membrane-bound metal-dependent hydrolase YbcI (DUF457 family)
MNTFDWLLVGHLAGDWVLQNDWMARGKKRGLLTLAGAVHVAVYAAAVVGALWLSGAGERPGCVLIGAVVVVVSHWLIDSVDVTGRWMRLYRQSSQEIVRVMVDQALHVLVLVLLALLAESNLLRL